MVLAMTVSGWAQETQGGINITVLDQQGGVVQDAVLELIDLATSQTRVGVTQNSGTFGFVNLSPGLYRLAISMPGFRDMVYDEVTVSATKVTDISATLELGAPAEVVTVQAVAPLVESTQQAIGTVIDMKQIQGLPLSGRNVAQLSRIVAGYTGTWNGLPSIAQGNNVDGVIGSPSRMKFSGNSNPSVQVRLENIEEMTVQTDQMDMNQGFGMAAMQSNFITKRGTNAWHGNAYWDHRNDALNANSWRNNTRGVERGGVHAERVRRQCRRPAIRDKLFFFFSLSTARQPGEASASASLLTAAAQQGNFSYVGTDGNTHTVNVFDVAQGYDPSLPGSTNSVIGSELQKINQSVGGSSVTPTSNPIIDSVSWLRSDPRTYWYPTMRGGLHPHRPFRFELGRKLDQTRPTILQLSLFPR